MFRAEQDELAAKSQEKAGQAIAAGTFKEEIVPVSVPGRKGPTIVRLVRIIFQIFFIPYLVLTHHLLFK